MNSKWLKYVDGHVSDEVWCGRSGCRERQRSHNLLEDILERFCKQIARGKQAEGCRGVSHADIQERTAWRADASGRSMRAMCGPGQQPECPSLPLLLLPHLLQGT